MTQTNLKPIGTLLEIEQIDSDHIRSAMIDLQYHRAIRQLKREINQILDDLPYAQDGGTHEGSRQYLLNVLAKKSDKLLKILND